jgi:hypothetical protein
MDRRLPQTLTSRYFPPALLFYTISFQLFISFPLHYICKMHIPSSSCLYRLIVPSSSRRPLAGAFHGQKSSGNRLVITAVASKPQPTAHRRESAPFGGDTDAASCYPHVVNADPALPRNNIKFQLGLHHHAHLPPKIGIILVIRHHVRCHCMPFSGRKTTIQSF